MKKNKSKKSTTKNSKKNEKNAKNGQQTKRLKKAMKEEKEAKLLAAELGLNLDDKTTSMGETLQRRSHKNDRKKSIKHDGNSDGSDENIK